MKGRGKEGGKEGGRGWRRGRMGLPTFANSSPPLDLLVQLLN